MNRKEGAHARLDLSAIRTVLLRRKKWIFVLPLLILLDRGMSWSAPFLFEKPKTCKIPRTTVEKFFAEVFK